MRCASCTARRANPANIRLGRNWRTGQRVRFLREHVVRPIESLGMSPSPSSRGTMEMKAPPSPGPLDVPG